MLLTVNEIAQMLRISENSIYRLIKQDKIPHHKINDQYRFSQTEIMEWATSHNKKIINGFSSKNSDNDENLPNLLDAVIDGGIFYNIQGNDQKSVLKSIVDLLNLPEDVDREFLYQVLLSREELGSTAVGNGIAIPHVRNPVVLSINKPLVMICFIDNPIDFKAPDGKPVNILFVLISNSVRVHLRLLSRIGFILHNQSVTNALIAHESPDIILKLLKEIEETILN